MHVLKNLLLEFGIRTEGYGSAVVKDPSILKGFDCKEETA
jgi:hypothetical protein